MSSHRRGSPGSSRTSRSGSRETSHGRRSSGPSGRTATASSRSFRTGTRESSPAVRTAPGPGATGAAPSRRRSRGSDARDRWPPEPRPCSKPQHRYLGIRIECLSREDEPVPPEASANRPLARRQAQRSTEAPEDPVVPPDDVARGPHSSPKCMRQITPRRLGRPRIRPVTRAARPSQ